MHDHPIFGPIPAPATHPSFPITLSPSITTCIQDDRDDTNENESDEYIDENVEQ